VKTDDFRKERIMQNLIDKYKLVPHPEGGYYAVIYESKQSVKSLVENQDRKAVTHILHVVMPSGQSHKSHFAIDFARKSDVLSLNKARTLILHESSRGGLISGFHMQGI
jgi:predicted cupin superfamily sugar epimerase